MWWWDLRCVKDLAQVLGSWWSGRGAAVVPAGARSNSALDGVTSGGHGLLGMRERVALWGGTRQRAADFLATEIRRHAEIVRASGARVD